jgi:hypothetical protein
MSNVLIVDDQDASIQYTGHWNTAGQLADFSRTASAGSSGDSMSFSFSGRLWLHPGLISLKFIPVKEIPYLLSGICTLEGRVVLHFP